MTLSVVNNTFGLGPTQESSYALANLLIVCIVGCTLLGAYVVREARLHFVHESSIAIILGTVVGYVIAVVSEPDALVSVVVFSKRTFFLFLLPAIIFTSGYNLDRRSFFNNLGSLLIFALLGTLINTIVFAGLIYAFNFAFSQQLNFVECLVYGSVLSATDPVTVLSIFKELRVDRDLYANVFGESVLNDAIAIVLYKTFSIFLTRDVSVDSIFIGFGTFLVVLLGSSVVGICFGLWSALFFKYTKFYQHVILEGCMVFLFAYASYLFAEGFGLSGIISILFCGLCMAQYTLGNLSQRSRLYTKEMFEVIATLSELVVFAYLGMALFSFQHEWDVSLIFISIFSLLIARFAQVVPLSILINLFRFFRQKCSKASAKNVHELIPWRHVAMLWFAGLRGALSFALSLAIPTASGGLIRSSTLIVCIFTIFVMGSFSASVLKLLGIKVGVSETFSQESKNIAVTRIQDTYLLPFFSRRVALTEGDVVHHDIHDPALVDEWMATDDKESRIANQFEMSAMII